MVVDITNDGQQSSTNPFMNIDPDTGRVTGADIPSPFLSYLTDSCLGGAEFAASFGPGRYSVFTCVDFKGVNVEFTKPTEFGVWLGNFPIRFATNLQQVYFGT